MHGLARKPMKNLNMPSQKEAGQIDEKVTNMSDDYYVLTTTDNPWNPFTHFMEWYNFDTTYVYPSCTSLIARKAFTSPEFPESMNDLAIKDAIDDICRLNPNGKYRRIYRDGFHDE